MLQATSPKGEPSRGGLHLAHVEGLRALAAYVVFVNHAYAQVWNPRLDQYPPSFLSLFTYSLVAGHLSVSVFIVISGFCLTLPVVRGGDRVRGGVGGFLKRRARRILPPYYGAVALCLLLIWTIMGERTGTLWDVPIMVKDNKISILYHLLLIQDFFGTSKINYVFWSIAVEWQIYFLFPLLVWSWRRYGPMVTVSAALVIGYALRLGLGDTRVARAAPQYLGLFALGMLGAYVAQSGESFYVRARERFPWGGVALGCIALVCVLSRFWGWELAAERFHLLDLPTGIAAMCVLVLTSRSADGRVRRLLSFKPLVFIGTFSYSVYLVHAPLLQMLWQFVFHPAGLGPLAMFAALMLPGALAVLAASYGFFRVCEQPFLTQPGAASAVVKKPAQAPRASETLAPVPVDDGRR
jgi:peptidoglycan/LPS O-acetylase OafA/YrhL